jgi:hypothetical protein
MKSYYLDIEREFSEFVQTVPYIDNPRIIHSPRLYGILHHTCTQIESLSKLICDTLKLNPINDNFYNCYNKLNEYDLLTSFKVILHETGELILPFKDQTTLSLDGQHMQHSWWVAYNRSKHKYPEGLIHATIGHVISSLSAAYILHEIARIVEAIGTPNILEKNQWYEKFNPGTTYDRVMLRGWRYAYELDSKFFLYLTEYKGQGAPL